MSKTIASFERCAGLLGFNAVRQRLLNGGPKKPKPSTCYQTGHTFFSRKLPQVTCGFLPRFLSFLNEFQSLCKEHWKEPLKRSLTEPVFGPFEGPFKGPLKGTLKGPSKGTPKKPENNQKGPPKALNPETLKILNPKAPNPRPLKPKPQQVNSKRTLQPFHNKRTPGSPLLKAGLLLLQAF